MLNIKIDKIIRSKRQRLKVMIMTDGSVIVKAPLSYSLSSIQNGLNRHADWVLKQQQKAREKYIQVPPKSYVPGDKFLYLGDEYELLIAPNNHVPLSFDGNHFILADNHVQNAPEIFRQWYKKEALRVLTERANVYSPQVGLKYNSIQITNAKHRWGSCNSKGNICFTLRLIMAPLPVIDYVVVHELVHIIERNHSSNFWSKVKSISPEYKNHRDWLKKQQNLLSL
jgi:predicted metal-dependent hydrolase